MKNLLLLLLLAFPFLGIAQGVNCADMDPICTDQGATFTANTGTTAEAGNDYGCLGTQPNPSWYYFEISSAGAIDMDLSAPSDIDFIVYGPYSNLAAAQGDCGTLDAGDIVDCSFSATATETPSIPNAQVGEVYIMLITNYANTVQNVSLTQTGGTGATDCSVVQNPPCFMSFFQATVSPCDPLTDTYEVSGQIDFEDPPTTGNLVVEDCNGNIHVVASAPFTVNAQGQGSEMYTFAGLNADGQPCDVSAYFTADPACSIMDLTYTAPICNCFFNSFTLNQEPCNTTTNTFDISGTVEFTSPPSTGTLTFTDCLGNSVSYNAPFTSPLNWEITGITPNGTTNCTVTATFSAEPACTFTSLPFNHPADCDCPVDAGTFTTTVTGSSTSTGPFELCFGDSLTILPNGDFIPPADIGPPAGGTYNPGMHLLIYDCAPTVFSPQDFTTDPCFLGIWDPDNPAGPWGVNNIFGNNQTFYFMPLTLYDYVNYVYSFFFTGSLCYDLGPAYPVTFLEPIATNVVEDCFAGTATATISGGTPANDGSNFTAVAGSLVPATASFVNTTAANGGTITINGLVDGDMYAFDVEDDNGCPVTISGTFVGMEDASFNYDPKYCQDAADPLPTITGVPGGTFSATPAGLVINTNTGLIDVSASTPGLYTITYVSPAANCWGTETYVLEINPLPDVVAVENSPVCVADSIVLGETGGDATEWLWTTSGGATFSDDSLQAPSVYNAVNGETFTVSATDATTGCMNTDAVTVTVNPLDDPTFTVNDFCFGGANSANVTGTLGGTFSFNPDPMDGAAVNPSTGEITNEVAGTTYTIQYLTPGACPDSLTLPVTVNPLPTVSAPDETICDGDNVVITATGANTYSWTPGTGLNTTVGAVVNASPTTTTMYTVTGTDVNGCVASDNVTVTVNPLPVVNPIADQTLCAGDLTAAVNFTSATAGATFDWTNNNTSIGLAASGNGNIAAFNVVNTGPTQVIATISVNATANGCPGPVTTFDLIINPTPNFDPIVDQTLCEGDNTTAVNFVGTVVGTQFNWTNSNAGIGIGANGTGTVASVTATNATSAPITGNFNVVPVAAGCVGTAETFAITVNPLPDATIAGDVTVCENDPQPTITFTGTAGVEPYTFTYTINNGAPQQIVSTGNTATIAAPTNVAGTFDYDLVGVSDASALACLQNVTGTATVIVNPTPTVDPIADQDLCEGDNIAAINFVGAVAGTQFDWTNSNTGIGIGANGTGAIASVAATNATSAPITGNFNVVPTAAGCVGTAETFIVTVNPLPNATIAGTATVCENDPQPTITFTGTDGVAPYTFTYTLNNGAPQQIVSTGNTATITVPTNVAGTFDYDLVSVSDASALACLQNVTGTATVIVNPTPTVDPIGDQLICEGDNTVTVNYTGAVAGTQFDWTNTNTGIGLGANGVGNVTAFAGANATNNPVSGTIEVTPSAAGCVGLPESFVVTVNPLPNATISGTVTVCENDPQPTITFTGSEGVAPYTFTYTVNNGASQQIVSVGNTATVTVPTNAAGTFDYDLVSVQDASASNCLQNVPGTATVTVNPNPTPTITGTLTYCSGFSATLGTANAYNTYLWSNGAMTPTADFTIADNPITVTVTNANGCSGTSAAVNVVENTTIVYPTTVEICQGDAATIHGQQQTVAGVYDQTFVLATGCDSTSSVTLVVNPLPVIDAGLDVTDCEGAGVTLNATGAPTIAWDVAGIVNNQQFFPAVGTVTYTATGTDANGCSSTDAVDVTINPSPVVDPVLDQVLCNGDLTTGVNFTGTVVGTTFDWVNDTPSIGLAANGTGDIAAFTTVNTGSAPVVATITVTPTANGCQGTPTSFTITVNPTPVVDPILDQAICNGDLTTLVAFGSATTGTTFDWTNNDPTIGLTATGNGDIAAFTAVNTGSTPVVATITVTPTANTCVGAPVDYTITVNPSPNVDPIVDQTVCNGIPTTAVVFTGATPGTTFDWVNDNTGIGLAANGTGDIAPFNAVNLTNASVSGTITVTPTLNGCSGTPESFTISVDPPPTMDPIADQSICEGDNSAAVSFTSPSGVGTTFDWVNDNPGIGMAANGTGDIQAFVSTNGSGASISGTVTVVPTLSGCIGLPEQFVITVNPLPTVDAGQDVTVCEGDLVTLTASGADTYNWQPLITNGQAFVPGATETYVVTGTDANGCVNTDDVLVTVEPLPAVSFVADTMMGCEGLAVTFTNTTPGAFTDCFWSFSNGTTTTGCGSVTVTFEDAGLFDATLTTVSAAGCSNSVTYTDFIYVENSPVAAFTPSSSVVSIFDSEISFNNQSSGATTYNWDFGDGSPNVTEENPTHQFPSEEAGGYTVWLTAYSPLGCPDSTFRTITINEELIFYVPNTFTPDNDDFNQNWHAVFTSGYDPFDFNLFIFNRWGEVIWESHDASVGWDATYGTNGRPVQDGTYTWKIDFKTTLNDERVQVVGHVNVLR